MYRYLLAILLFLFSCTNSSHKLTLEEKVGQVLMVHVHGEVAGEDARALICDLKVGGIIYYNWANGLNSPDQVRNLSEGLQKLSQVNRVPIPLLIAVDQEGGRVQRLRNGFTPFPSNGAVGETGDPSYAHEIARSIAKELKSVGVNMNLAPDVDVNSNPQNPVIGNRSFSSDPYVVAAFGSKALEGYRQEGIIATLKHYPGHGDTKVDSHEGLPIVNKSMQELQQMELIPFAKLAKEAEVIMTAHLLVPAFDEKFCATYSKKILDYLREEIGFQGVIMTDSLVMKGALQDNMSIDEAAIAALKAGSDIILLGGAQLNGGNAEFELKVDDIKRIRAALVSAVRKGQISEERLNEAVNHILQLKERYLYRS